MLAAPWPYHAALSSLAPHVSTVGDPSIGSALIKMVISIVVLGTLAFFLKRIVARRVPGRAILARRGASTPRRGQLRVISRQTLGKGAWLAVVEWEEREVLVGITSAGISFYDEGAAAGRDAIGSQTDDRDEVSQDAAHPRAATTGRPSMIDALRDLTVRH